MEIPRADSFIYCISLKFGVNIICLMDIVASIFSCINLSIILVYPEILSSVTTQSDILWTVPETMPSVRAHLLLSSITLVMSIIGAQGTRYGFLHAIGRRLL
jgi:hypothetical protein